MWFTWKYAGKHVIFMKVWFTRRSTGKKIILVMHLSRSWYSSRHICRSTEFFIVSNFFTFMACSVFCWTFVARIGLRKDWVFLFPLEFTAAKFVSFILHLSNFPLGIRAITSGIYLVEKTWWSFVVQHPLSELDQKLI